MVSIPTSTTAQAAENTQLNSLSQTSEGGNFITMETRPVVMVTESVMQSLQDGQGVVTDYHENNHSLLGNGGEKLAEQTTQSYTLPAQTTGTPQQTDTQFPTKIPLLEVSQTDSVPVETAQDVSAPMEAASDETKQHMVVNENSLDTAEEEQSIQDYSMQTPSTESTNNSEQMNVPLMFESGQQLTEETAAVASHSSAIPTVNNSTAVFTQ